MQLRQAAGAADFPPAAPCGRTPPYAGSACGGALPPGDRGAPPAPRFLRGRHTVLAGAGTPRYKCGKCIAVRMP